jgi:hypothetical protein
VTATITLKANLTATPGDAWSYRHAIPTHLWTFFSPLSIVSKRSGPVHSSSPVVVGLQAGSVRELNQIELLQGTSISVRRCRDGVGLTCRGSWVAEHFHSFAIAVSEKRLYGLTRG